MITFVFHLRVSKNLRINCEEKGFKICHKGIIYKMQILRKKKDGILVDRRQGAGAVGTLV